MLLTRSFFNRSLLRSDLRRCWPLFAGYAFLWFLILPLRMWNDVPAALQANHPDSAREISLNIIATATQASTWINLFFGLVLAMALFSYLSGARATYGMHSFPASRSCQFRTHVLGGVGCVVVTDVLICLLSAQSGGTHWGASLSWLVFSLVTFLLFFALGILCCMLCAWLPAMIVAYAALNSVAILCRILVDAMCQIFYPSYNDSILSMSRENIVVWLTPVLRLRMDLYEVYSDGSGSLLTASAWKSLLVYGIVAVVLLIASALLYRIRRSEASGDTLAFRPLRPVVRWAVGLLGGLGLGIVLSLILSCTNNTVALLACIIALGLVCMVGTQMLIARTPRVFGKLWPELLALCAVLLALTLCIKGDLFGFEQRVPQADQVESVEIRSGALAQGSAQYKDPDEIAAILQTHKALVSRDTPEDGYNEYGRSFYITYQLKNGGTLSRQYYLPTGDLTLVLPLLDTETFRRSLILSGTVDSASDLLYGYVNVSTADGSGRSYDLTTQQSRALYEAALEDAAHLDMTDDSIYYDSGRLVWINLEDKTSTGIYLYLNPQCTRTLALLQTWGLIETPNDAFGGIVDQSDYVDAIEYSGITYPAALYGN